MEIKLLFQLLIGHLIILVILKAFFAISERPKSKEKPVKASKPDKSKEVKQDLISKKEAQKENNRLFAPQNNIAMFNYQQKPDVNEESSIDKYLKETKKFAKIENERRAREEFLKNADNPLNNINANNKWLQEDLERDYSSTPNSYNYREVSPPPRPQHPFLSDFANSNFTTPLKNNNQDYERVNNLIDELELDNSHSLPISDSFKSLTREMQIFVITKLINKSFK